MKQMPALLGRSGGTSFSAAASSRTAFLDRWPTGNMTSAKASPNTEARKYVWSLDVSAALSSCRRPVSRNEFLSPDLRLKLRAKISFFQLFAIIRLQGACITKDGIFRHHGMVVRNLVGACVSCCLADRKESHNDVPSPSCRSRA